MPGIAWTSGVCSSGGEDIYYEVAGEGEEPVVFCHGLGGNHAVWFQQVPVFAERYRVITWDQRGFGMSSNRGGTSGPPAAVGDLHALLDHLAIGRAHLVGQSMGGWCVAGFALRSRDRVRSLVLADTTGGIMNEEIATVLRTADRRSIAPHTIGAHAAVGDGIAPDKAFLYQQIGSFRGAVDDGEMITALFSTRYSVDEVRALGVPALCVVGANDDLMPPAAIHHVAGILGASCIEIEAAGHSPYFEKPDEWNAAVLAFLAAQ